ncbi:hypothetical protein OHA21_15820 [Actinoplanes sp. NBC_00393]
MRIIDTTERSVTRTAIDISQWMADARVSFANGQLQLAAGNWADAC